MYLWKSRNKPRPTLLVPKSVDPDVYVLADIRFLSLYTLQTTDGAGPRARNDVGHVILIPLILKFSWVISGVGCEGLTIML
jgi:hypothetical protein